MNFILVANLAKVGNVGEQLKQRTLIEVATAALLAALGHA